MSWIHFNLGYYFCLALFFSVGWYIYRRCRQLDWRATLRGHWPGLLLAAWAGLSLQVLQEHQMRVFNDEPAHQITARMMHEHRQVALPQVGYYLEGQTDFSAKTLSYRMYFYAFLVSLAHDLTGFRVANAWVVNGLMGLAFFLLAYGIGNRFQGKYGGLFAVLLAAGLPLLDRSATSAGYDLTNMVALAGLFMVSMDYIERPGKFHLFGMITAALVAAYSRNESSLYLIYLFLVVGGVFLRSEKQFQISWFAALSPVFLIPAFVSSSLFRALQPASVYSEIGGHGFFQWERIPENFQQIAAWLFDFSPAEPSWPVLSLLGLLGLVALLTHLLVSWLGRKPLTPQTTLLACYALVASGVFVASVLAQFWNPLAGEAVRFLLPLHLLLLLAAIWWFKELKVSDALRRKILVGLGILVFWLGLPARMSPPMGNNAAFAQSAAWSVEWLAEHDDGETLYLSQLNTLFLLHDYAALDWDLGVSNIKKLMQLVREGYYDQVLGFVIERYDVSTGVWAPVEPTAALPETILTHDVEQRRYAYNTRARFFAIDGFIDEAGNIVRPEDLVNLRELDYDSIHQYFQVMQSIHPGYQWRP
ncbi:MAG: hypothetical protein ACNA77_09085 [Opitutales bacterium]